MSKNMSNLLNLTGGIVNSFSKLKFLAVICVVGMAASAIVCSVYAINAVNSSRQKVYVIDHGQSLSATLEDQSVNRVDEIDFLSRRFHSLLFNVPPVKEVVERNLELALEVSDKSVYKYFNTLQERGFYKDIYETPATQAIQIDSIVTTTSRYPYPVVTYGTVWITRPSNVSKSNFVSRCYMREVPRNFKNQNGLEIEDFNVIENRVLETRRR